MKRIGVFMPAVYGPHQTGLRLGIGDYVASRGDWRVHLVEANADRNLAERVERLKAFAGDGAIVSVNPEPIADVVRAWGKPIVSIYGQTRQGDIPSVGRDFTEAGRMAGRHFIQQGLVHAAYFAHADTSVAVRCDSEIRGLGEVMGIDPPAFFRGPRTELGKSWTIDGQLLDLMDWLCSLPRPLGVFCFDDEHGSRMVKAAHALGLDIPRDIAILGNHNDRTVWPLCDPPLSSIELDLARVGYEAARMLDQLLEGRRPEPFHLSIQPEQLIPRASSERQHFDNPALATTLQYIRENLPEPLTVEELADHACCSVRTLHRQVRRATGRTPAQIVSVTRVETALQLLAETDLSMTHIADRTGLGYSSNFTRVIRKAVGCTPSEYRRRMGQM